MLTAESRVTEQKGSAPSIKPKSKKRKKRSNDGSDSPVSSVLSVVSQDFFLKRIKSTAAEEKLTAEYIAEVESNLAASIAGCEDKIRSINTQISGLSTTIITLSSSIINSERKITVQLEKNTMAPMTALNERINGLERELKASQQQQTELRNDNASKTGEIASLRADMTNMLNFFLQYIVHSNQASPAQPPVSSPQMLPSLRGPYLLPMQSQSQSQSQLISSVPPQRTTPMVSSTASFPPFAGTVPTLFYSGLPNQPRYSSNPTITGVYSQPRMGGPFTSSSS
jgi:hypothetical protein